MESAFTLKEVTEDLRHSIGDGLRGLLNRVRQSASVPVLFGELVGRTEGLTAAWHDESFVVVVVVAGLRNK